MDGKHKAKAKKQQNSQQCKVNGPMGSTEGRKDKAMAELHGVEALMVNPLSPKSSIKELQQQRKDTHQFLEWLTIMKKN